MLMIEKTPHSLPYLGYVKLELSFQMKEKGKIEHYAWKQLAPLYDILVAPLATLVKYPESWISW